MGPGCGNSGGMRRWLTVDKVGFEGHGQEPVAQDWGHRENGDQQIGRGCRCTGVTGGSGGYRGVVPALGRPQV
jgi:hypothetical protein